MGDKKRQVEPELRSIPLTFVNCPYRRSSQYSHLPDNGMACGLMEPNLMFCKDLVMRQYGYMKCPRGFA